jgi:hypothetical protein
MPRPRVTIDERRWPLVFATWPAEPLGDAEFEEMVLAMSRFTRRGEPYAVVHDARRAARPTPRQRAFAATHQQADAEASRRWLRGAALVVSTPLIAGVATAINWITPSPYPQKFFSSIESAEAWAVEQLETAPRVEDD